MDSFINEDLSTIESISPFLKQCVGKGKEIPTGNILQVQQVTNVSFPTYDKPNYDSDKHTLKLTVTDGQSQGYALVPDSCPGISTNTAPGTKIRTMQPIPVHGSLFLLSRNNCEVIGGKVAKLFEKWEIQKKMAIKHDWGYTGSAVEGEGPPPWKPFGYKPTIDVSLLRRMKTTDVANKKNGQAGGSAKSQFDVQRDEAISELQATANKQKFQKPNKHLVDKEITDIMEEGFSQSDAEYAMNRFKNTQKALKFLKDSKKHQDGLPREPPKPVMERKDRRKKGKGKDEDEEQEVPVEYQRPTKSISLFGFIEGQIKADDKPAVQNSKGPQSHNYGRSQDLEDGMGRLNFKDSRNDSYYARNDRGRGRGGFNRGGGNSGPRGGGNSGYRDRDNVRDREGESYQPHQQRYENRSSKPDNTTQRPPRFQNRGGNDGRPSSDHNYTPNPRNQSSGGNYDNYRGSNRDNYDTRSYPPSSNQQSRHDYSGSYEYQSHQQRPTSGKDAYEKESYGNNSYGKESHGKDSYYSNNDSYQKDSYGKDSYSKDSYGKDSYSKDSYGKDSYSKDSYGKDSYSKDSYGKDSYSKDPYGKDSYSKDPYGKDSYRKDSYGKPTYGNDSYGKDSYREESYGNNRSYGSDYYHQQYQKSTDYPVPVPSQNSQSYQQSYPPPQQHQSQGPRQYSNNNSQNYENMGYTRSAGQQRAPPPSHYSNHSSSGGHPNPPPTHPEFTHYQYGYEGWNPTQSLVFTRSKADSSGGRGGGGGYSTSGREVSSQSNSYSSRGGNNKY